MSHKGFCDKCGREVKVKRLGLGIGSGAGAFLCRPCWTDEMAWRKQRNRKLGAKAKFSILKFS